MELRGEGDADDDGDEEKQQSRRVTKERVQEGKRADFMAYLCRVAKAYWLHRQIASWQQVQFDLCKSRLEE